MPAVYSSRKRKDAARKRLVRAFASASLGGARYFEILRKLKVLEATPVAKAIR